MILVNENHDIYEQLILRNILKLLVFSIWWVKWVEKFRKSKQLTPNGFYVMRKQVANPVWILGWFWDLGLINLAALFYGAPLLLHGVHGCFLSGCVCCKVQGRRRLLMREDGAELIKEDGRRQRMVGSRIGRDDCWIGKLLREANGIRGVFGAALEEKWASFCSGQKRI
jgi:hypothetical protein